MFSPIKEYIVEEISDYVPLVIGEDEELPRESSGVSSSVINLRIILGHTGNQIIGNISEGVRTQRQVTQKFCLFVNFVLLI